MTPEDLGNFYSDARPLTASQRKKLKKKQQTVEMDEQLAAERAKTPNLNAEEDGEIRQQLAAIGKIIVKVVGDGNCMFRAVEHQLVQERYRGAAVPEYDHVQLRKITAEYIRTHRKDFEGFVCSMVDSLEGGVDIFEEYCRKVARNGEWGGELELKAMSELLNCKITVYKRDSQPVAYGPENYIGSLHIVFHQYAYSLGGHYNSTM